VLKLTKPDIALIPNMCDYPGLIVHKSFDEKGGDFKACPIGTGPFELVSYDVGQKVVYKRRTDDKWWDGEVYPRRHRVHRLRHRSVRHGQRLRSR
jgi:peptide/nickel transport system substrate-binding protein